MWRLSHLLVALLLGVLSSTASGAVEPLAPVLVSDEPIFKRPTPWGPVAYTPGRGLQLGRTGFTIGGYTNVILAHAEGEAAKLEIDPVSLFVVWDPTPRLHLMTELQYADLYEIDEHGHASSANEDLTVERLYADFAFSDSLNIRAGVFLTPVGRWNVIHIAPLVWTTEQPIATELPFDPNLTGIMIHGAFFPAGGVLRYALYDQFAEPIEGNPEFEAAEHSIGGRLEYDADTGWSVGASYLASRRDGAWNHLGGLDLLWNRDRFEIMGEFVISEGAGHNQWGAYLQGVYGLTERLSLIQRFEHYALPAPDPHVNLVTLGLAYRPFPGVVLKTEYVIADRRNSEASPGLYASMATLF